MAAMRRKSGTSLVRTWLSSIIRRAATKSIIVKIQRIRPSAAMRPLLPERLFLRQGRRKGKAIGNNQPGESPADINREAPPKDRAGSQPNRSKRPAVRYHVPGAIPRLHKTIGHCDGSVAEYP